MEKKNIQDIFYEHLSDIQSSGLPLHVKKVAENIAHCRTNAMEGHMYSCPEGHYSIFLRNSCNNRNCPTCQGHERASWRNRNNAMVLNTSHYQLVFKLPSFCYPVFLKHYKDMTGILFDASKKTIDKILKYSQYEFSTPGVIMALHTYGDDNQLHPHIHVVMTGGGLSSDNSKWISYEFSLFSIENFRTIYTAILKRELTKFAKKNLPPEHEFHLELVKLKSQDIYLSTQYANAEPVINYLSKTVKGNSIHNHHILEINNGQINYQSRDDVHVLDESEFIRRYLTHVLPPFVKSVRYSGLYSPASRERLQTARSLIPFQDLLPVNNEEQDDNSDSDEMIPFRYCIVCKKKMELVEKVLPFQIPYLIVNKFGKDPPIEALFSQLAA